MTDIEQKRESRIKKFGEVYTPPRLVSSMLAKLPKSVWKKSQTWCDPACGSGNMIVLVLLKKLERGHNPLLALKTVFGVDIMADSVKQCRLRLLKAISIFENVTEEHVKTVFDNIRWINIKQHPGGSLDYDFSFTPNKYKQSDITRWMKWIEHDNILDTVELPVEETEDGFGRQKMLKF
jgi:type I restriction-modification system DNA methylase subunit